MEAIIKNGNFPTAQSDTKQPASMVKELLSIAKTGLFISVVVAFYAWMWV
ncbi:hypothetical protein [Vibrio salinus]|nr:hypothetical protein [Vibrio salinus]MCE0495682.1 hypothetical protein [Vibrio salinus]